MSEVPERQVQAIAFGDGVVRIEYAEAHDLSDNVAVIKTLMFQEAMLEDDVTSILSDIDDLIDAAIDKLRNPPMTRPSGLR